MEVKSGGKVYRRVGGALVPKGSSLTPIARLEPATVLVLCHKSAILCSAHLEMAKVLRCAPIPLASLSPPASLLNQPRRKGHSESF